ncbi:YdcF family protein [Salinisphaera aquimarina]|uniref:YdcF family protein n=1 Tax=Salinisphaera aquimarina TaxID=2094031 RepID=A0ABV7ES31_9GAMM
MRFRPACLGLGLAALVVVMIVGAFGVLDYARIGRVPAPCDPGTRSSADVALVLGGGPHYRRTRRGVALFDAGRVRRLAVSGDARSARHMAAEAERSGVPAAAIATEARSLSTYDNFRYSCRLPALAAAKRIAIVTDQFHAYRAYLTAKRQCNGPVFCSAPVRSPTSAARRFSETLKLLGYQLLGRADWW